MALEINELADLRHEIIDVSEIDESHFEFRIVGRTGDRFRLLPHSDKLVLERIAGALEEKSLAELPVPEPRSDRATETTNA